jgi:hypothetical protein
MSYYPSQRLWLVGVVLLFFLAPFATGKAATKDISISVVIISLESCCPDNDWPEAERKTEAELRFLGYQVSILPLKDASDATSPLGETVQKENAFGGVRISRLDSHGQVEIELWAQNPSRGTSVAKHISFLNVSGNQDITMIALRISEALDACRLELGLLPPRQTAYLKFERPWSVSVGVSGLAAANGLPLRPGLELSLDRRLVSFLSLEWVINTSPWGPSYKAQEQSFSLSSASSSLWLFGTLNKWNTVRPALGVGVGTYFIWSKLAQSTDYAAQTRTTWTSYLGLCGRVGWFVTDRLQLQLGVRVGALLPQVVFRLNGQTVKSISNMLVEGILSAGWSF